MHYNAKVKSRNDNGASSIFTFFIEADSESEAVDIAKLASQRFLKQKNIEVWFISDQELEQERWENAREKAMAEYESGGYDEFMS